MNKTTFNRIKMLRKDGMGMKGAIAVIIDLCNDSEEASEKIVELVEFQPGVDYDRGFCDALKEVNYAPESITNRKEHRNYDPKGE